jgi:hypothetical protein
VERRETRAGDRIASEVNLHDPRFRAVMALRRWPASATVTMSFRASFSSG